MRNEIWGILFDTIKLLSFVISYIEKNVVDNGIRHQVHFMSEDALKLWNQLKNKVSLNISRSKTMVDKS